MPDEKAVPSREEALSMLHITQPFLLMRDVKAVTGWDSLEALRGAVEQLEGHSSTETGFLVDPAELQALRACWQTGREGQGAQVPLVLELRDLKRQQPAAVRQKLKACTWQECTVLLLALQGEQDGGTTLHELRWVITSHWLEHYGHLRWGEAFQMDSAGAQHR